MRIPHYMLILVGFVANTHLAMGSEVRVGVPFENLAITERGFYYVSDDAGPVRLRNLCSDGGRIYATYRLSGSFGYWATDRCPPTRIGSNAIQLDQIESEWTVVDPEHYSELMALSDDPSLHSLMALGKTVEVDGGVNSDGSYSIEGRVRVKSDDEKQSASVTVHVDRDRDGNTDAGIKVGASWDF